MQAITVSDSEEEGDSFPTRKGVVLTIIKLHVVWAQMADFPPMPTNMTQYTVVLAAWRDS